MVLHGLKHFLGKRDHSPEKANQQLQEIGIDPKQVHKYTKNVEELIRSILTFPIEWKNSQLPNTSDITTNTHTCTSFERHMISERLKSKDFFGMKENNQHNYDTPKGEEKISIKDIKITKDKIIITIESKLFSNKEKKHSIPVQHQGTDISKTKNITNIRIYDNKTILLEGIKHNGRTLSYNVPEQITLIWGEK